MLPATQDVETDAVPCLCDAGIARRAGLKDGGSLLLFSAMYASDQAKAGSSQLEEIVGTDAAVDEGASIFCRLTMPRGAGGRVLERRQRASARARGRS